MKAPVERTEERPLSPVEETRERPVAPLQRGGADARSGFGRIGPVA